MKRPQRKVGEQKNTQQSKKHRAPDLRGSVNEIDSAVGVEQWGPEEHQQTSETEELRLSDIDGNLELTDTTEPAKNNVLRKLN
jgi:hypothetical protein